MNISQILIPLYLLISLGLIFKYYKFPNDAFWPSLERFIYYVLFPALLFVALVKAPVNGALLKDIILVILLPALLIGFTQWLGFLFPSISSPTFSSMYQGAVRNNTAVVLVIAPWVVPDKGIAIVAVVILILVPFNNIVSVLVLNHYGDNKKRQQVTWWKGLIKNPLIIACIAGILVNFSGIKLPLSLLDTADFLGKSALPLALLAVGSGLKLGSIFHNKIAIILSSVAKLLVLPILAWGACILFQIDTETAKIALLYSAVPTATSSFILARQMGGDAETMAQLITFQTLLAAFTLPIFLAIAQSY